MRIFRFLLPRLITTCLISVILITRVGFAQSVHPFKIKKPLIVLPNEPKIGTLVRTYEGYYGEVYSVDICPDGLLIASSGTDKAVHLWSLTNGELIYSFTEFTDSVTRVFFSPDGKLLASQCENNLINILSLEKKKILRTFKGSCLTGFTPDGKWIVFVRDGVGTGLWSVETGTLKGAVQYVPKSISPDGKTLSASNFSTTAYLVSLSTGRIIRSFKGHKMPVHHVIFSPDNKIIATSSALQENIINIWAVKTGKILNTIIGDRKIEFRSLEFSPDSKVIAAGCSDGKIRLWEVKTCKFIGLIEGHSQIVTTLHFSSDGKFLLSGSTDTNIKLWSLESIK